MAHAWITPKTNWVPNDGIQAPDLNRIESNNLYNYEQNLGLGGHLRNYISGFEVSANTPALGVYDISVSGGIWSDVNGNYVDWGFVGLTKTFSGAGWVQGGGQQCKLSGATFSTNKWYWVFALYNPTTNAHDFALDDNFLGSNLGDATAAGYTLSRRICALLTTSHITTAGFMPMVYDTNSRTTTYAGLASAREITIVPVILTSTPIVLNFPGGQNVVPIDTSNAIVDTGVVGVDINSFDPCTVTVWQSDDFGATHYDGIGTDLVFEAGDTQTVYLRAGQGAIRVFISSNTGLTLHPRTITYNTDQRF